MTASGDVSDYDTEKRLLLLSKMARTLNVLLERISLIVLAASVELLFTIELDTADDTGIVAAAVDKKFPTAAAASEVLGISVLEVAVDTIRAQPSPASPFVSMPLPPASPRRPPLEELSQSSHMPSNQVFAAALVSSLAGLALCILAVLLLGRTQIKTWMRRNFSKELPVMQPTLLATKV